jgi:hypothetical protein
VFAVLTELSLRILLRISTWEWITSKSELKSGRGPRLNNEQSFFNSSHFIRCRCSKTRARRLGDSIATLTALRINVKKYGKNDLSHLYIPPGGSRTDVISFRRQIPI